MNNPEATFSRLHTTAVCDVDMEESVYAKNVNYFVFIVKTTVLDLNEKANK